MKKTLAALMFCPFILSLSACNSDTAQAPSAKSYDESRYLSGSNVIQTKCMTCHTAGGELSDLTAPLLVAVKEHYVPKDGSEKAFVDSMTSFVLDPKNENTLMPGAIKKFGIMPKMGYTEAQVRDAAYYLYYADLEKPDWFEKHMKQEQEKFSSQHSDEEMPYADQGLEHALATKSVLGKNLLGAIKSKGTDHAVEFCNEQAIPLTHSMKTKLGVNIKRVSDKNRNPDNAADLDELQYIVHTKKAMEKGEKPSPMISEKGEFMVGYYPITTNQMCLQCHGQPNQDIKATTLTKIEQLYPKDKAVGYGENELRGIWVIEMPKKS